MKPETSLPHSQVPTTCPYPEPDRSISYTHIQRPEDPTPIYTCISQVVSFPSGFPTITLYKSLFFTISAICPPHHIILNVFPLYQTYIMQQNFRQYDVPMVSLAMLS
jgi:hypothetical protein